MNYFTINELRVLAQVLSIKFTSPRISDQMNKYHTDAMHRYKEDSYHLFPGCDQHEIHVLFGAQLSLIVDNDIQLFHCHLNPLESICCVYLLLFFT